MNFTQNELNQIRYALVLLRDDLQQELRVAVTGCRRDWAELTREGLRATYEAQCAVQEALGRVCPEPAPLEHDESGAH